MEYTEEHISLDNGKYTVVFDSRGKFKALRHGMEWRDLTGDNMILAMFQRIQELEDEVETLKKEMIAEKAIYAILKDELEKVEDLFRKVRLKGRWKI